MQWFPHLDTPVCLYSVDEAGGRRLVATLAPGASTMQYFYIGSGWLVTDEEYNCFGRYHSPTLIGGIELHIRCRARSRNPYP